tara:strand:+ start:8080 stop:8913 length:834 start_codon:yes stop_codon:yes gene_type:complete
MKDLTERVGLIAGDGVLPLEFIKSAKKEGISVVGVGLTENSFSLLKNITDNSIFFPIGKPMEIIDYFKLQGVKNIGFAGKVDKRRIFTSIHEFDEHARKILENAGRLNDVSIMNQIIDFIETNGLKVISQLRFLKSIVAQEGSLNQIEIDEEDISEFRSYYQITRKIADLDIGQTVVFKNGAVIAVEGIEGTDATLYRSHELGVEGSVICKVARPSQDPRYDLPVIGLDTIDVLKKISASALVMQANGTLVTDYDEVMNNSEMAGIKIYGLSENLKK